MISKRLNDERGAVLVIVAAGLTAMVLVVALVIEVGNWYEHKRHLQLQADAAALAGGASFQLPGCSNTAIYSACPEVRGSQGRDLHRSVQQTDRRDHRRQCTHPGEFDQLLGRGRDERRLHGRGRSLHELDDRREDDRDEPAMVPPARGRAQDQCARPCRNETRRHTCRTNADRRPGRQPPEWCGHLLRRGESRKCQHDLGKVPPQDQYRERLQRVVQHRRDRCGDPGVRDHAAQRSTRRCHGVQQRRTADSATVEHCWAERHTDLRAGARRLLQQSEL
ncbi:MAG: hypothetical protein E6G03_02165 [Actinobacteria bacterium]|nr:MAG: hypothetical protein E6G03_02165 [Actinomycetota bacterium]